MSYKTFNHKGVTYAAVPVEDLEALLIAAEQDDSEEGIWNRQRTAAKEIRQQRHSS